MSKINNFAMPEILVIGEVLFDIFPDYRRLGGAPFNFAIHMQRMGFATQFVSRVGKDDNGKEIMSFMAQMGLESSQIQKDPKLPTGCVKVELDERGIPKFDILANVAYDNLDITVDIDHLLSSPVKLIYFGTLIQRTPKGFDTVQQILKKRHPTTQTFCDLNFRLNCYSKEVVLASLKQTDILKLNYEELMEVGQFIGSEKTTKAIITHLMKDYQINTITVTRGAEGSEWFNSNLHSQTDSPEIRAMVDTVGAGDAFAAATATGILKHWPVDQILNAASQFAAQICGVKGALPADDQIYEKFRTTPHKKG